MSTWGRSNLVDDDAIERPPALQSVAKQPGRWRLTAGLIIAGLALGTLWVKPWERQRPTGTDAVALLPSGLHWSTPGAGDRATARAAPSSPAPTLEPVAIAARDQHCRFSRSWHLLTKESSARRLSRSLWAGSPATATGPGDPELRLVTVRVGSLRAVGICGPKSPVMSPAAMLRAVVLWQISPDGTVREVTRPRLSDVALYDLGEAYFAPPAGEGLYWPEGRYIFEIRRMEGPGSRWIGLEFVPTQTV